MISDEERREVAARLRDDARAEANGDAEGLHFIEWCARWPLTFAQLCDRLADLVDRPTTRIEADKHGRACCANCGCDDWCLADGSNFCPNCGAQVVRDE